MSASKRRRLHDSYADLAEAIELFCIAMCDPEIVTLAPAVYAAMAASVAARRIKAAA